MIELLLTLLAFIATAICVGLYWQVQKSEARIMQQAAIVREQAQVVGELADEISLASTYLYEAMDHFLVDVEARIQEARDLKSNTELLPSAQPAVESIDSSTVGLATPEADENPAWWEIADVDSSPIETVNLVLDSENAPVAYHPHFQALKLAAEGNNLVEIARQTGLGVEELRLLLHFQDELSISG